MNTYNGLTTPADWRCRECGQSRAAHALQAGQTVEGVVIAPDRLSCPVGASAFERERHDFVAMLRIRNEARWIGEVIEAVLPLCGRVFVMDDHSEDETVAICSRYPAVTVWPSPFQGFNEARDKTWLLDCVEAECEAQWILCIDGDEILEDRGPEIISNYVAQGNAAAYSLQIIFLWNERATMRTDWVYGDFWRPSLFRQFHIRPDTPDDLQIASELRFMATSFGRCVDGNEPNLHCSSVPQRFLHGCRRLPTRLKHLGYLDREDRVRKLDRYTALDWLNRAEDCYRHVTQGDSPQLSELPAIQRLLAAGRLRQPDVDFLLNTPPEMRLVHAGPLTLRPFDESVPAVCETPKNVTRL